MDYKQKYIKYKTKYLNQKISDAPRLVGGNKNKIKAICTITGTNNNVNGTIYLDETDEGTHLHGYIDGLTPGKHGFHIHESADLSKCCDSLKGHYNPFGKTHGDRVKTDETGNQVENIERHVGDLGNVIADYSGRATIDFVDTLIKLRGETSVIGRSIIVHADEDDLGLGGTDESLKTVTAGKRIGCGIIGFS